MVYCLGTVHVHLYVDLIASNTNSLTLSLGHSYRPLTLRVDSIDCVSDL